jgi:hypothetical protein
VSEGNAYITIETTQHHPFWDETSGRWVDAGHLQPGHSLRSENGDTVVVQSVHNHEGQEVMRDLTVAEIHTYYVVAGDKPVLVHNCGGKVPGHPDDCNCAGDGRSHYSELPDRTNPEDWKAETREPWQPVDRSEWATDPKDPAIPTTKWGKVKYGLARVAQVFEKVWSIIGS